MENNNELEAILTDFFLHDLCRANYYKKSRREGSSTAIARELVFNYGFNTAVIMGVNYDRLKYFQNTVEKLLKRYNIKYVKRIDSKIEFHNKTLIFAGSYLNEFLWKGWQHNIKKILLDVPIDYNKELPDINTFIEYEVAFCDGV